MQQTPSVQNPLAHSASALHPRPIDLRQTPAAHSKPDWQSGFAAHAVRQVPVARLHV
jgi:hypothetical protein